MGGGAVVEIFTFHRPLSLSPALQLGLCALPAAGLTSLLAFGLGEEEAGERVPGGDQHHHTLATDHHRGRLLRPHGQAYQQEMIVSISDLYDICRYMSQLFYTFLYRYFTSMKFYHTLSQQGWPSGLRRQT